MNSSQFPGLQRHFAFCPRCNATREHTYHDSLGVRVGASVLSRAETFRGVLGCRGGRMPNGATVECGHLRTESTECLHRPPHCTVDPARRGANTDPATIAEIERINAHTRAVEARQAANAKVFLPIFVGIALVIGLLLIYVAFF
ncbi:hypothetical protein ACFW1A_32625 [Kitasatospora sp. NPDC058965]|uniref:hypothetical protein n=1 Tax=Kitasatospora sp. NPDC058965 TaxID=3346682 RepID=UPI0036B8BB32